MADETFEVSALDGMRCFAATTDGSTSKVEEVAPLRGTVPGGAFETAWFWQCDETPVLPNAAGAAPVASSFPLPGGVKFGVLSLPPGSGGRMRRRSGDQGDMPTGLSDHDAETGMHATRSLDLEFVISGRLRLELPGGITQTLGPGDSIVMAGAPHRWSNPFDEPCVYAAVIVGAR